MKRICYLIITLILFTSTHIWGQNYGFIQVKGEGGIKIYIDNTFVGTTNLKDNGLIIQNIKIGRHNIRAIKLGFDSQEKEINLKKDQVYLFNVKPFVPKIEIVEEGNKSTSNLNFMVGSLVIQSLPIECTISIPAVKLNNRAKSKDRWTANNIPIGTYEIILVSSNGRRLTKEVIIKENQETHLFVNFLTNKTETRYPGEEINIVSTDLDVNAIVEAPSPPKAKKVSEPQYFVAVEEMPTPIGGLVGIQKRIKYTQIAVRAGIEGKVYVLAFVNTKGIVTKARIIKGLGAGLDKIALKAIKETRFDPGKQRGKPVNVQVSIPLIFKMIN